MKSIEKIKDILRSISEQSTRKDRGSQENDLCLNDLNIIREKANLALSAIEFGIPKWVEIKSGGMPEQPGLYFTTRQHGQFVDIEKFDGGNFTNYHGYKVTHWMEIELPETAY